MSGFDRRTLLTGLLVPLAASTAPPPSAWRPLFNGKNLDGWEQIGDGVWSVMSDGTLLGDRKPKESHDQAWVYTKEEFGEFDPGPVNIACFFGKPSLTLFGATNPDYVKTNFEYNVFLQKELGCSARNNEKFCLIGGMIYQCSGIQCMNLLSVEDVYNALLPLLNLYCKKKI